MHSLSLSAKYLIKGYFNGFLLLLHSSIYLYLLCRDAVVGVGDEGPAGDGAGLPDLGADEEADRAEKLQLHLGYSAAAEEAVHDVHGEGEHLGLAVLLVHHLQHPLGHDPPHVGRDPALPLEDGHVVGHRRQVLLLVAQQVLQEARVEILFSHFSADNFFSFRN